MFAENGLPVKTSKSTLIPISFRFCGNNPVGKPTGRNAFEFFRKPIAVAYVIFAVSAVRHL
jgi:hypothetical protein